MEVTLQYNYVVRILVDVLIKGCRLINTDKLRTLKVKNSVILNFNVGS